MKVVAILGFGISGKGAYELLNKLEYTVYVFDRKAKYLEKEYFGKKNIFFYEDNHYQILDNCHFLIKSPGIFSKHGLIKYAIAKKIRIISEIDLAIDYIKNIELKPKIIAITGTNGKSSFATLLEKTLTTNGYKSIALGNIGKSFCEFLSLNKKINDFEFIILELSSFQLEELKLRKIFDLAILLNISIDHLKWHKNLQNYVKAKLNLQNVIKNKAKLFLPKKIINKYKKHIFIEYKNIVSFNEEEIYLNIIKDIFNYLNIKIEKITFPKINLSHRLEFVGKINDIAFYNDSKSTNVESTIYAVNKIKKDIVLIAGGMDKGLSYKKWNKNFQNKVKAIFLIGSCAKKIKNEMMNIDTYIVEKLEDAVKKAYTAIKGEGAVLFSPGTSSFDMFKNFEERGEKFKYIVSLLQKEEKQK